MLLPSSFLVYFGGLAASGALFFRARPFDAKAAAVSDIESPDDNPRGYGWAAAGTAVSAVLLLPAGLVFHRRLSKEHPALAGAGAVLFAPGAGSAIAIGLLSPYTRGYTPVHVQLAFASFIGICGGTMLFLFAARAKPLLIELQCAVLVFLVYLYFGPDVFDNSRLLSSLALWEWVLCADCAVALWALARAVEGVA